MAIGAHYFPFRHLTTARHPVAALIKSSEAPSRFLFTGDAYRGRAGNYATGKTKPRNKENNTGTGNIRVRRSEFQSDRDYDLFSGRLTRSRIIKAALLEDALLRQLERMITRVANKATIGKRLPRISEAILPYMPFSLGQQLSR